MPRRQQEQFKDSVVIRRAENGFIVGTYKPEGFMTNEQYVANDYEHLTDILKELLGPVELFPEDSYFTETVILDPRNTGYSETF